jgi:hypothetical protein
MRAAAAPAQAQNPGRFEQFCDNAILNNTGATPTDAQMQACGARATDGLAP